MTLAQFSFSFKDGSLPVSATSMGAIIGTIIPGIGTLVGAGIGALIDVGLNFVNKDKAKRRMKRAMRDFLIQRYNNQVFTSALERMAEAMMHLVELGLKPGTADFDIALKKKLYTEIGYQGNCAIDLFGPGSKTSRPLLARIDKDGKVLARANLDPKLVESWNKACRELHAEALKAWAQQRAEDLELQQELKSNREEAARNAVTRILVNTGILAFLVAYNLRQKKKLQARQTSVSI